MTSITHKLRQIGKQLPLEQPALINDKESLSYNQLANRISKISYWITSSKINVIGLHIQNSIDWVVIDLACQEAGIICVPLPTFFSQEQLIHSIQKTGIDILFTENANIQSHFINSHQQISPIGLTATLYTLLLNTNINVSFPKGTQKVTFTSGSTGTPKGVCLSMEHQWQVADSLASTTPLSQTRHLCLLPLSTLLENIAGVYAPLLNSGSIYLSDDNTRGMGQSSQLDVNTFLAHLYDQAPNSIIIIPQLLSVLIQACQQGWQAPSSLHFIAVGGAKISADLITQAQAYGLPVYQGYGLSECGSVISLNTPNANQPYSVGKTLSHCRITIENNEIIIEGACHLGYLHHPSTWYPKKIFTGDTGYFTDGYLTINGRLKNTLITSFGRNISPEWVESELTVSIITQCMVVGDGQPYLSALISTAKHTSHSQIQTWINHVNQKMPDYAQIHSWIRINESAWRPLSTPNGRLHRPSVSQRFKLEIQNFYR
ncbi:AMP-binding protein [Shewanella surugensis]|uniref:AMP-binding protein n=1 Tax=Shewanella surugensis TaxID=212020 RepID=A0ABT0LB07_9GAMM|nr:AMP-binding protein [Shewanella surugensis]MCL1124356.1 AMP-binding protein [Shewanella surugensis]